MKGNTLWGTTVAFFLFKHIFFRRFFFCLRLYSSMHACLFIDIDIELYAVFLCYIHIRIYTYKLYHIHIYLKKSLRWKHILYWNSMCVLYVSKEIKMRINGLECNRGDGGAAAHVCTSRKFHKRQVAIFFTLCIILRSIL